MGRDRGGHTKRDDDLKPQRSANVHCLKSGSAAIGGRASLQIDHFLFRHATPSERMSKMRELPRFTWVMCRRFGCGVSAICDSTRYHRHVHSLWRSFRRSASCPRKCNRIPSTLASGFAATTLDWCRILGARPSMYPLSPAIYHLTPIAYLIALLVLSP